MSPAIVITVGTDVHPFDRLVHWADRLVGDLGVDVLVQFGTSITPAAATGRDYIPHDELRSLMRGAACVVTHGGPASVMDARASHARPVVVPRDPARGEHVDGHQMAFADFIATRHDAVIAHSYEVLRDEAASQIEHPLPPALAQVGVAEGVQRFSELMDGLMGGQSRRRRRR